VDSFEINRNNVIYSYQKNRNPFIDHPEYVDLIWTGLKTLATINENGFKVYPNPVSDYLNIVALETAQVTIYSMNAETIMQFQITGNYRFSTNKLNSGLYVLQIKKRTEVFTTKLIVL